MASDIRSLLRYIEDYANADNFDEALLKGIQAIHAYDKDREFSHSISILEKLIEFSDKSKEQKLRSKLITHILVRLMLMGKKDQIEDVVRKYGDIEHPLADLVLALKDSENKGTLAIDSIEKQSIFGSFKPIQDIPYLQFENQSQAIRLVEDLYEDGRYILNLFDTTTKLYQSIPIDIGRIEDVHVVERDHIFKLKVGAV